MKRHLSFGVLTLQNLPYPILVERWRRLESLGFDSAWVADHYVDPYAPAEPWFEGWTLMAALAAQTSRIRLGPLVASLTLHNPALLARRALTIDHITNGRFELAIGAGRAPLDHSMTGITPWETPERTRRFREFVEITDRLLRTQTADYQGRHYQVAAHMSPPPIQRPRPRLTLAAHGPATLKIVAQYADTWNSFGAFNASPAESLAITRERNRMLDEYCALLGRDPRTVTRSFLAGLSQDRPFASPGALSDFVGRYQEAGIDEFIFYWLPEAGHPVFPDHALTGSAILSEAMLERLALEDIPALRASAEH